MEKLRRAVNQIAYTQPSQRLSTLSPLQLSLIPLLSFASSLYTLALSIRHSLYHFRILRKRRLPVPVISVGNLTWGGNGKTPMVEFIAFRLANSGISPLILTRGYGGADEARMLQRHLHGTSAKIGVGANRAATAAFFLEQYGHMKLYDGPLFERLLLDETTGCHVNSDKIGVAILDDGMQHLSVWRDLEIVMVNGMMPWGNNRLVPLGPLREPLRALRRADVVVVHNADMVAEEDIKVITSTIEQIKESLPIYFTRLAPSYFFKLENISCKLPLNSIYDTVVLCVSAIGFADSFVQTIKKMKPLYADHLDFSDHYEFQTADVDMIRMRLRELAARFSCKSIVVLTEKDYDREPEIFKHLEPFEVLVLCSKLQIVPWRGCNEDSFKTLLRQLLKVKYQAL